MIKVGVCGALGKMGQEVVQAVTDCPETELVAKIDIASPEMYHTIEAAHRVEDIDVIIDFTQPKSIFENAKYCLNNGIKIVIGTTGLSDEQIAELKKLSQEKNTGCLIAPNFSTGAVLMMMFAKQAAKYFDNAKVKVAIDHHSSNTMYADYNFISQDSPACAQLLLVAFSYFGIEVTKEILNKLEETDNK